MQNCVFCKIVSGEIPAEGVYEDKNALGFLDIKPVNIGHTLVIPKKHFKDIYETPEKILAEVMKAAKKVSIALKKAVQADGTNVNINNEPAAGQVVCHFHVHVIPRKEDDGLKLWHSKRAYQDEEAKETAKKIISML